MPSLIFCCQMSPLCLKIVPCVFAARIAKEGFFTPLFPLRIPTLNFLLFVKPSKVFEPFFLFLLLEHKMSP